LDVTKQRTNNEDVSSDEVVLNIENCDVPELTLVDLPGLIGSQFEGEKRGLKQKVLDLVKKYINQPHAIVLAVAPANVRLRDNDILGMVKEAGAEDRTIGLLTKCDLANERNRLEDILNGKLSEADRKDQERIGYIHLKRGYYGMICRDTLREDRPAESSQTQDAIEQAKVREKRSFDDMKLEPVARGRCGVSNVDKALTDMFREYIHAVWTPDTLDKLDARIKGAKSELKSMRFSDRYEEPPSAETSKTHLYLLELKEQIGNFSVQVSNLLQHDVLRAQVHHKMAAACAPSSSPACGNLFGSALPSSFTSMGSMLSPDHQSITDALAGAEKDILLRIKKMEGHARIGRLPVLGKFLSDRIEGLVRQAMEGARHHIASIFRLEAAPGFKVTNSPSASRLPIASHCSHEVGLMLTDQCECDICHETLKSDAPLDYLLCCSKMLHRSCLDRHIRHAPGRATCPRCRKAFEPAVASPAGIGSISETERQAIRKRLLEQSCKAADCALREIHDHTTRLQSQWQEEAVEVARSGREHLLQEDPSVGQHRQELRHKLKVLEDVQEQVNNWGDL